MTPIAQLVANTAIAAGPMVLVATSIALLYRLSRFFDFSVAATVAVAPYCAFLLRERFALPMVPAIMLGVAASALLGCAIEATVQARLRSRRATPAVRLLASLGVYVIFQNALSIVFGDDVSVLRQTDAAGRIFSVGGASITGVQLAGIAASAIAFTSLAVLLAKSGFGRMLRAVSEDSELAQLTGIRTSRVVMQGCALACGISGIAGVAVAFDVDMLPSMGLNYFLWGVVAVVLGNVNSLVCVAGAAILLAGLQQIGIWVVGSQWQEAIAFAALLAIMLIRRMKAVEMGVGLYTRPVD